MSLMFVFMWGRGGGGGGGGVGGGGGGGGQQSTYFMRNVLTTRSSETTQSASVEPFSKSAVKRSGCLMTSYTYTASSNELAMTYANSQALL